MFSALISMYMSEYGTCDSALTRDNVITYAMHGTSHHDCDYGQGTDYHHEIDLPDINVYIIVQSTCLLPHNLQFVTAFSWTPSHDGFHDSGSLEVSMHKHSAHHKSIC